MLASLTQGAPVTIAILGICFVLVLIFEFSNGFHDTANAVATVIYTNSLKPTIAVVWSGAMNFIGVVAAGMLVAIFAAALLWNVGTWWIGIPNSSSHALIGALIGVALEVSLVRDG